MSAVDTGHFRGILEEERQRVVDAISYLHEETPGSLADETEEITGAGDNHLGETATATLDREIDYSLEENSEQVLRAIDGALRRIDEGIYRAIVWTDNLVRVRLEGSQLVGEAELRQVGEKSDRASSWLFRLGNLD